MLVHPTRLASHHSPNRVIADGRIFGLESCGYDRSAGLTIQCELHIGIYWASRSMDVEPIDC